MSSRIINHTDIKCGDFIRFSGEYSEKMSDGNLRMVMAAVPRDGIVVHIYDEIHGAVIVSEGREFSIDFESNHLLELISKSEVCNENE